MPLCTDLDTPWKVSYLIPGSCWEGVVPGGGGDLYFRLDIILVKGLSKQTLNTYFSGMKIDPKCTFFLICPSCHFQNLSIWPKTHPFSNSTRFCTPKQCTCVHCLVLKNNLNYVNFFNEDDIQLQNTSGPRGVVAPHRGMGGIFPKKYFLSPQFAISN